jgi:hypothetical protein
MLSLLTRAIKHSQLASVDTFAATLHHELSHAQTGFSDPEFKSTLTDGRNWYRKRFSHTKSDQTVALPEGIVVYVPQTQRFPLILQKATKESGQSSPLTVPHTSVITPTLIKSGN